MLKRAAGHILVLISFFAFNHTAGGINTLYYTTNFKIYNNAGTVDSYVAMVGNIAEQVWYTETSRLSFKTPTKADDGYFPIVIDSTLPAEIPGKTYIEDSWCLLNPLQEVCPSKIAIRHNLTEEQAKVTLAHELFHAIQFEYSKVYYTDKNRKWWNEASAGWMADETYDNINQYIDSYKLDEWFRNPHMSMDTTALLPDTNIYHYYGELIWVKYLTERYGIKIIRDILSNGINTDILTAIDEALKATNLPNISFESELLHFMEALWAPKEFFGEKDEKSPMGVPFNTVKNNLRDSIIDHFPMWGYPDPPDWISPPTGQLPYHLAGNYIRFRDNLIDNKSGLDGLRVYFDASASNANWDLAFIRLYPDDLFISVENNVNFYNLKTYYDFKGFGNDYHQVILIPVVSSRTGGPFAYKYKMELIPDDDTTDPDCSDLQSDPPSPVYDSYVGDIRIKGYCLDLGGIYEIQFMHGYGGVADIYTGPTGQDVNSAGNGWYWYDIPYSEWSQHIEETISWRIKATDNDNDRSNDRSTNYSDWGPHVELRHANQDPQLSNGKVQPSTGTASTDFAYYIDYYDSDGDSPTTKNVVIDGTAYPMSLSSGADSNGTYWYGSVHLSVGSNHWFYFYFEDGKGGSARLPASGSFTGPTVIQPNNPPTLNNAQVQPNQGPPSTLFTYSADFSDPEGDTVTVTLETYDPSDGQWESQGSRQATGSTVTWENLQPFESNDEGQTAQYRFHYDDSYNQGTWGPFDGPTITALPNNPPNKPTNTSPTDGTTSVSVTPTLQASAFSDPDGDSHQASQWQICIDSTCSTVTHDSGKDTSSLTSYPIPSGVLSYNTTYWWHVRYKDGRGAWSSYSDTTSFTTVQQGVYEYQYYAPHALCTCEYYPANDCYSNFIIIATENGTNLEIDENGDGTFERQVAGLSAGERVDPGVNCDNHGNGNLSTGTSVRSDKPLFVNLRFIENDYGTYDAGHMVTTLYPTKVWGNQFVVPTDVGYVYIFAKTATQATITRPGESPTTESIAEKQNIRLSDVPVGTMIETTKAAYVLAVNCQSDQNYCWSYTVLPTSLVGSDYYYDASYSDFDDWGTAPKLWITAVNNGTTVNIDEDKDGNPDQTYNLNAGKSAVYSNPAQGAHIWCTSKVYVTYVENWSQDKYGKYGGAATEYLPTNLYGKTFAAQDFASNFPNPLPSLFTVASGDSTSVSIDYGWDGTDDFFTLNQGELRSIAWTTSPMAHIWSDKGVQVVYKSDGNHPDHPGVDFAYTAIPLNLVAENNPPTANAGPDQTVTVGDTVQLNGTGSSDPDGDPLTFNWQFLSKPSGSTAALSGPNSSTPTFIADRAGEYTLQLAVDDGRGASDTDTVLVTAITGTEAVFRVTKEGTVYADRAFYCGLSGTTNPPGPPCFNTGTGADIAEYINVSEPVGPGDVIELDPDHPGYYRKSRGPYSKLVVGVVSIAPGMIMGVQAKAKRRAKPTPFLLAFKLALNNLNISWITEFPIERTPLPTVDLALPNNKLSLSLTIQKLQPFVEEAQRPLLALMGVVPVKATTENGPIKPGDLLTTSSTLGYAMRCNSPKECEGAIIGKALEPLQEGIGVIKMLVMR